MRLEPVTVALPRDLVRWLKKAARETDQTLGSYVRRVLKLHRIEEEDKSHARGDSPTALDPGAGPEAGGV